MSFCLVLLAWLPFCSGSWSAAQSRDGCGSQRGCLVPGARVVVTNISTKLASESQSNEASGYTAASLPGRSVYGARGKGGIPAGGALGIELNAASTVRVDVTLEVGTTLKTVEVGASAVLLSTENAKTSVTVTNKLVDELPLVVSGTLRSPFDLAALTPEAKNLGGDDGSVRGGGQGAGDGTTLDGISTNTTRALQLSMPHRSKRSPSLLWIPTDLRPNTATPAAA